MSNHPALADLTREDYSNAYKLPSREQIADKMWSESCIELARIRDMLEPAFARHQKALDALQDHGREAKYPGMGKLLTEAWREFQVQLVVEAERSKGRWQGAMTKTGGQGDQSRTGHVEKHDRTDGASRTAVQPPDCLT